MSVVATKSERIVTGIILEKTLARVVVQTATEKITLSAEDVDSIKDSAVSLMPDGQLDQLTSAQVRDLIAYVSGRQQVPLPAVKEKK